MHFTNFLLSIFLVANLSTTVLSYSGIGPLFLGLLFALTFLLLQASDKFEGPLLERFISVFFTILALGPLLTVYSSLPRHDIKTHPAPALSAKSVKEWPPYATPPNIYFFSLDAISSRHVLDQLMGLGNSPFWNMLERHGFSIGEARSPGAYTLETFYTIFTLRTDTDQANFDFLRGLDENPIMDRLTAASYYAQSIQGSTYFGLLSDHWDYASPKSQPAFDFCWSVTNYFFLYGICSIPNPDRLTHHNPVGQVKEIEDRVRAVAQLHRPAFTFAHVLWPSHTPSTFHFADTKEKSRFVRRYKERLDALISPLDSLFSALREVDPNAVVIVHGDHGPWLTRGWTEESRMAELYTKELADRDRYSVLLAVRTSSACAVGQLTDVKTTADVLPRVFKCFGF